MEGDNTSRLFLIGLEVNKNLFFDKFSIPSVLSCTVPVRVEFPEVRLPPQLLEVTPVFSCQTPKFKLGGLGVAPAVL